MTPPDEVSWGYQDLLLFTIFSLFSILGCQLLVRGLVGLLHAGLKDAPVLVTLQLLAYACVFAVLFALIKLQYGRSFWSALAWKESAIGPGAAFLLGLTMAICAQVVGFLLHTPDVDSPFKRLLSNRGVVLGFSLIATTIGPLTEELTFRGFLQPVIVRSLGRVPGVMLTALLFGAVHLSQYAYVWQLGLLVTAAGAAFGFMRQWTGSTKASTYMHAGFNSTIFLTLLKP